MTGSDFLQLDPVGVSRGDRTDWLTSRIRHAVLSGQLAVGARLPATRVLATELGFARGTVSEAYRRLAEEALITARAGAGTVVAALPPRETRPRKQGAPVAAPAVTLSTESAATAKPVIDLASGLPDLAAFPRSAWLRAEKAVLDSATARQLGYAPPQGMPELRRELAGWLVRSRGVVASPDQVIVTAGVTGAVSLLAQILRADGNDAVAVEDPGADGTRRILTYWLRHVVPVRVDERGLNSADLAEADVTAALVTPAHQYPTGVVLAPDRRRDLIAWSRDDRLLIEDDYDAEYRYDRRPVRAMQPLAPDCVAYTASLSKTLAPALRLGWLVAPTRLHNRLVELRWAIDLGSPAVPQLTLAHLLRRGTLERHLRSMRHRHRVRRDATVEAVRRHLPRLDITGVAAGLHLVLRLPDDVNDVSVAADAEAVGVLVQPLSKHYTNAASPGLIVNYAACEPARMRWAIETLARVVPNG